MKNKYDIRYQRKISYRSIYKYVYLFSGPPRWGYFDPGESSEKNSVVDSDPARMERNFAIQFFLLNYNLYADVPFVYFFLLRYVLHRLS